MRAAEALELEAEHGGLSRAQCPVGTGRRESSERGSSRPLRGGGEPPLARRQERSLRNKLRTSNPGGFQSKLNGMNMLTLPAGWGLLPGYVRVEPGGLC